MTNISEYFEQLEYSKNAMGWIVGKGKDRDVKTEDKEEAGRQNGK